MHFRGSTGILPVGTAGVPPGKRRRQAAVFAKFPAGLIDAKPPFMISVCKK